MIGTSLLNRYELLEKIGEGGMGIVYKAKCSLLNRFVAVKILKSELSTSKDFIDRFMREANSIAKLSHPNIVSIHDVCIENNINFIVMEYIDGKTLKEIIIENKQLNPSMTLDICLQIAKALEFAHKNNVIHRDIKPDNILIAKDNIVKLTDFGIAKVADSLTITNSGNIIGSVHYFSPEQAKGKLVDHRTDIYAFGIVMYEMLTGQTPFKGDTPISIAIKHIQEPIRPPKELIHDIPEIMNNVILKALEKDPINRFRNANEIFELLDAIRKDSNINIEFNNTLRGAETVIMKHATELPDTIYNSTVLIPQEVIPKTVLIKNSSEKNSNNYNAIKNRKKSLFLGLIILFAIAGILGVYLFEKSSTDANVNPENTKNNDIEANSPEKKAVLPTHQRNLVPFLNGNTQDAAEKIIAENGFSLGNITPQYSDTIPKGLVISQSPSPNTDYDLNGKIDLIISQGQKATQTVPQTKSNGNGNGNGNGKDKEDKIKKSKSDK